MVIGMMILVICVVSAIGIFLWKKYDENIPKELNKLLKKLPIILIIIGICSLFFMDFFVTVDAGTIGVQNTFGSVSTDEFTMGLHVKNPFTDVILYSIQTLELKETSSVPSKEGLIITLDVSILFKINPSDADNIYRSVGPFYVDVVVAPQLRSFIREVTAKYEAKALYTVGRENITVEIFNLLSPILAQRGIVLEKVLLRDLSLPLTVTGAIEQKLKAEQEAEQMQFVLQKETLEADRKRIEARGIADSQTIIHESLTAEYLRWYWITHLKDYQAVYYVPVGDDGYPMMNIPIGGK